MFAREQMTARMQADPALRGLVRYGAEIIRWLSLTPGWTRKPFSVPVSRHVPKSAVLFAGLAGLMEDLDD